MKEEVSLPGNQTVMTVNLHERDLKGKESTLPRPIAVLFPLSLFAPLSADRLGVH